MTFLILPEQKMASGIIQTEIEPSSHCAENTSLMIWIINHKTFRYINMSY